MLQALIKGESSSKSKNKSWKQDSKKSKPKKDMAAVLKKYIRKELHGLTTNKKRKVAKDLNTVDSQAHEYFRLSG